ncbi:MAG: [protein-PII] uridylyltransferase [Thermoguttaceae bacterium]
MCPLRPSILEAKSRLAEGYRELKQLHHQGRSGVEVCRKASDLRDRILLDLIREATDASGIDPALSQRLAMVAHGGYGRREVAPFSDVDLMVLGPRLAIDAAKPLAERLFRDIFDAGLVLGHSLRNPDEACSLACDDVQICTSLIESRLLAGSQELFDSYRRKFDARLRHHASRLLAAAQRERGQERVRYGETVFMLEPNVKRSRGGLRDIQLLRWVGKIRYGQAEPAELARRGFLSQDDFEELARATEYLLRLRNEMHFHSGKPGDVLSRSEQLRIAAEAGYEATTGMLPVEQFMRDHFRQTAAVSHVVMRFLSKARTPARRAAWTTLMFGHKAAEGFRVGPAMIAAGPRARQRLGRDLGAVLQLVDLANLYDKQIEPETWEVVRGAAGHLPEELPPKAMKHFLSLVSCPARLGDLLRLLHEVRLLERFLPAYAHARGLLQFNQYHKYTVDEHCFRAIDIVAEMQSDQGALGQAYREIRRKHVLHLALLLHDVGKGYADDHAQVGARLATENARLLGLSPEDTEMIVFLVANHLVMNHLAFRRDTTDEQLLVRFAVDVGSAERLGMLYVMTAADLGAVGPGVWDGWKEQVLTDLYRRVNRHLAGDPGQEYQAQCRTRRHEIRRLLADAGHDDVVPIVDSLPPALLGEATSAQTVADLTLLAGLDTKTVDIHGVYQRDTNTIRLTVATREDVAPGIFHRLTGAIAGRGLQILSAEINTLDGDLVLDRFVVVDPDFAGQPPPERFEEIRRALAESLDARQAWAPSFRKTWRIGAGSLPKMQIAKTRIEIDNASSRQFTILDVFAVDQPGLLYAITKALFDMGMPVQRAKIGTYLDQVVDVFYVTDGAGKKIESETRIQQIRTRLLDVILSLAPR